MEFTLYKGNRRDGAYTAKLDDLIVRYLGSEYSDYDWPIYRKITTWLTMDEDAVVEDTDQFVDAMIRRLL